MERVGNCTEAARQYYYKLKAPVNLKKVDLLSLCVLFSTSAGHTASRCLLRCRIKGSNP